MQFEWDPAKGSLNQRERRVSFEEAQSVFYDEFALQFFDDAHSHGEERFIMMGMCDAARLLVVVRCERRAGEVIRIISARKAAAPEADSCREVRP